MGQVNATSARASSNRFDPDDIFDIPSPNSQHQVPLSPLPDLPEESKFWNLDLELPGNDGPAANYENQNEEHQEPEMPEIQQVQIGQNPPFALAPPFIEAQMRERFRRKKADLLKRNTKTDAITALQSYIKDLLDAYPNDHDLLYCLEKIHRYLAKNYTFEIWRELYQDAIVNAVMRTFFFHGYALIYFQRSNVSFRNPEMGTKEEKQQALVDDIEFFIRAFEDPEKYLRQGAFRKP